MDRESADLVRKKPVEIRSNFVGFCGIDRYREFVAAIWYKSIPKGRLVYWQERLWHEFSSSSAAELPDSFDAIKRLFRICPRHLEPLEKLGRSRASRAAASLKDVPPETHNESFPFAIIELTFQGGVETLSCPNCRFDLEAFAAANPAR